MIVEQLRLPLATMVGRDNPSITTLGLLARRNSGLLWSFVERRLGQLENEIQTLGRLVS